MRWLPALWCVASTLLASSAAADELVPLAVTYDAVPGCPAEETFFAAVQARSGRVRAATPEDAASAVELRVTLGTDARRSWGSLQLVEGGSVVGRRRVEGASCEEVVNALALATALSLDALTQLDEPPSASPPPEPSPPPLEPVPPPPPTPSPATPPWTIRLGSAALFTEPVVPSRFWGGLLEGGATWHRTGPAAFLAFGLAVGNGDHSGYAWRVGRLSLLPARARLGRRLELGGGLLAEAGGLRAEGERLDVTRSVTRSWWGAGLEARANLELSPALAIGLRASGLLPGTARRFVVGENPREIASTPALVWLLALGVETRFASGGKAAP